MAPRRLGPVGHIRTMPYPGFPTDAQPVVMAMAALGRGTSIFVENIFESRYKHAEELQRMGARIKVEGRVAIVEGVERLTGARVQACDLRGGAALAVAGLAAGAAPSSPGSATSAGATRTCPGTWPPWGPASGRSPRSSRPRRQEQKNAGKE